MKILRPTRKGVEVHLKGLIAIGHTDQGIIGGQICHTIGRAIASPCPHVFFQRLSRAGFKGFQKNRWQGHRLGLDQAGQGDALLQGVVKQTLQGLAIHGQMDVGATVVACVIGPVSIEPVHLNGVETGLGKEGASIRSGPRSTVAPVIVHHHLVANPNHRTIVRGTVEIMPPSRGNINEAPQLDHAIVQIAFVALERSPITSQPFHNRGQIVSCVVHIRGNKGTIRLAIDHVYSVIISRCGLKDRALGSFTEFESLGFTGPVTSSQASISLFSRKRRNRYGGSAHIPRPVEDISWHRSPIEQDIQVGPTMIASIIGPVTIEPGNFDGVETSGRKIVKAIRRGPRRTMTSIIVNHPLSGDPEDGSVIRFRANIVVTRSIDAKVAGKAQQAVIHVSLGSIIGIAIGLQPIANGCQIVTALVAQSGGFEHPGRMGSTDDLQANVFGTALVIEIVKGLHPRLPVTAVQAAT